MTDRELLEAAAKAMGYTVQRYVPNSNRLVVEVGTVANVSFDPLNDDGDVARLEAALGLHIIWESRAVRVGRKLIKDGPMVERYQDHGNDRQKARRWASVRAAAALGGVV